MKARNSPDRADGDAKRFVDTTVTGTKRGEGAQGDDRTSERRITLDLESNAAYDSSKQAPHDNEVGLGKLSEWRTYLILTEAESLPLGCGVSMGQEMTENLSPLNLLEAPFRILEERVPFGRLLVTTASILMSAVVIVFVAQNLFILLDIAAAWITCSIRTGEPAPFSSLSRDGPIIPWILVLGLSVLAALTVYGHRRQRKLANHLIHYAKREVLPAAEKVAQAAVQGRRDNNIGSG
jgi:hypothetical protein